MCCVKGDNTGALQDALRLRGKGSLNHVAREFAWRRAAYAWELESELNVRADALSRLHAPVESRKVFPKELEGVFESLVPAWGAEFWRTWLDDPPRKRQRHE